MTNFTTPTSDQWQPPSRPEWVQKINEEGECMDIAGVVPLDEQSLINSAIQSTGLSDFGSDEWREPFSILTESFQKDASLNLLGRIRTRSEIFHLLEARLQIEDTYKRYPEIDDEKISQPIVIIGQGRSGTSFLHNLLAANPDNGAILEWEAMFPCPPPEASSYTTDPRINKTHKLIDQWNRVTPTLTSMHEFAGNLPMEDCQVMALSFISNSWFDILGQVASYGQYVAGIDIAPALQYHRRVLKLLQWKNPRKNWVLKDPMHIDRLDKVLQVYPDAVFVWPHRDPVKAQASVVSLVGTLQWGRSDFPFKGGAFDYVADPSISAKRLDAVVAQIDADQSLADRVHHLFYKDFIKDPMACVEKFYDELNLEFSVQGKKGMQQYLDDHPRGSRPPHKVQAVSKASLSATREAYNNYIERFIIPME